MARPSASSHPASSLASAKKAPMRAIQQLIDQDIEIPSPPAIAIRILKAVRNQEGGLSELAKIIASDPALMSKILRVANSPFYGTASRVDSLQRAISILGQEAVKNITLSFVIAGNIKGFEEGVFDFDHFWKRSVTAAVAAELATEMLKLPCEDIFISALLQDIGITIMYMCRPDDYNRVLDEKRAGSGLLTELERRIFGFDHQAVGALTLEKWGLPGELHRPIAHHHDPDRAQDQDRLRSVILRISDYLSAIYHGSGSNLKIQALKTLLHERYQVESSQVDELIDQVGEKSIGLMSFFELDAGEMKPYSQILQDANAELGKLNLSYEQLVVELRQAKQKAEQLAQELKTANQKLRQMASRDGLTGIYNHRTFQKMLAQELAKAVRYQFPVSLILFDLDHFKQVNDQYGHPAGDQVLVSVCAKISELIRSTDIFARYGGEEFVLILPQTDLKGAVVLSERLRRGVEAMEVRSGQTKIRVTISLGTVTNDPTSRTPETQELVAAADKALYNSKRTGRNKFSVAQLSAKPA
ncbi:MAG: GGDEF domain-containing protein [Desulfobacterales bacterium]